MTKYKTPAKSLQQIYERTLWLLGLIDRSFVESRWPRANRDEREERMHEHRKFVEKLSPLRVGPSPLEQALHQKAFGAWSIAEMVDASWRTECVGVLLWAGRRIESLARYDEQFEAEPLFAAAFGSGWGLRAASELDVALTDAERWHSRARRIEGFYGDDEENVGVVSSSADAVLRSRTSRPPAIAAAMRVALGEKIEAFGKPYEGLTFIEFSKARSIARERHYALNWIWDTSEWDDVNTDT